MKITIHRGTDQIGGCVTEYESNGWRLFVDYGEPLQAEKKSDRPLQVEGLTHGDISKSALLITHYHGDHIGHINALPDSLPLYIGKTGQKIYTVLLKRLRCVDTTKNKTLDRLQRATTFEPGKMFPFGAFHITPITLDHSAFDAYGFKIEADGVKVFHTGDFRTHGFRSGKFDKLAKTHIGQVDYVVCEATNISRPDSTSLTESDLQGKFREAFKTHKYHIVYLSSTNIDRLFSLYHAAVQAKRPFYIDDYQKQIMDIITKDKHLWSKSSFYQYEKYEPIELKSVGADFLVNKSFTDFLEEKGYVLIARANDRFDRLIVQIPGEPKQRYLSMWKGYVNSTYDAYDKNLAKALGQDYKYLHTSGHCDIKSLRSLFELLQPKAIIPMHTDKPEDFAKQFSASWKVLLPKDGDSIHLNSIYEDSPSV